MDITLTAEADYKWLWGIQSAVEAVFVSQAKEDIAAYLEYNIKTFRELVAAGKVRPAAWKSFPRELGILGHERSDSLHWCSSCYMTVGARTDECSLLLNLHLSACTTTLIWIHIRVNEAQQCHGSSQPVDNTDLLVCHD